METEPATSEDWELIAKETLLQYYNRGGLGNGNTLQLLEGSNFINTIGYSLSLLPNVSMQNWTADHYRLARDGSLYYYEDKNLLAIEKIVNKLQEECNGSREVFVTILPISFFYSGSLFTLPLYRFKPRHDEKVEHFMDHTGRVYTDFEDWKVNNTLPAVQVLYPKNGQLTMHEGKVECVLENSAECSRPVKTLMACDIASGTLGILAGIGATIATGGTALLMMGAVAATATYGAGRTSLKIRDRVKHNETVNPFKNSEAFWIWVGLGADIITFGTLSLASTKLLSTFSQSTTFIDISRKFSAATRAMSIFSGTLRPISDTSKALLTGYELFSKLRHKSTKVSLKLPKEALIQLNDSIEEFSEGNMLMMAITEGYWSKSKMSYCSPEEFVDMVHETIISHMTDICTNKKLFEEVQIQLQNDAALIQIYKHLDSNIDLDHCIEVICDVFTANNDKMEIKLIGNACEIKLNKFHLSIKALAKLSKEERYNVVRRLQNLNQDQQTKLLTIQDYANNSQDLVRVLCYCDDDAMDMIEVWYDLFVICFDEHFVKILNHEGISIRQFEISLKTLKSFPREERLNIIFELKKLTENQSRNLKVLIEKSSDPDSIYRMLAFDDDTKMNLIASLNETD
ncbi:hypothetical protein PVAND_007377 [Polypedilum vanderplanki]|uniref:DUF4781 domain-containing protein n=1 Tax=Polypedilum vanderplanki TaxID=319348 RepID=A0A9J6C642_POLVA|nr:hypothetical protein PVAND_007377 [Polypedilum vanderplanki]